MLKRCTSWMLHTLGSWFHIVGSSPAGVTVSFGKPFYSLGASSNREVKLYKIYKLYKLFAVPKDWPRLKNNGFFFSLENYFIRNICVNFLLKQFHTVRLHLMFQSSKPVLFTEVFKRRDSVFTDFRTVQWRIYISWRFSM